MRSSYQHGYITGQHDLARELTKLLAGDVLAVKAGLETYLERAIPDDDYGSWSEDELRHERGRIAEALDKAIWLGPRDINDEDRAAERALDRTPTNLHGGLLRYLDHHIQPGHFLTAVLEGDLFEAFARGDVQSRTGIGDIVTYLYNFAPAPAWGNKRKVELWLTPPLPRIAIGEPGHFKRLGGALEISREGLTACPRCGGAHHVDRAHSAPGLVQVDGEGPMKQQHEVQFVWCQRVYLEVVGIDGREVER